MTGAARVNIDTAGGTIIGNLAPTIFVNGVPVAVLGANVAGHGDPPHAAPVMVQASPNVFANNIAVCREGDQASCGHSATGSSNVFIN